MEADLSKYAKKMILVIICASLIMIIGGAAYLQSWLAVDFALGVVMACSLNVAKVLMLKYAVNRVTTMEHGASGYTGGMYLLRFMLTGAVLVAAHFIPFVELLGAVFGLLAMPIASYALRFFIKDNPVDPVVDVDSEVVESVLENDSNNIDEQ